MNLWNDHNGRKKKVKVLDYSLSLLTIDPSLVFFYLTKTPNLLSLPPFFMLEQLGFHVVEETRGSEISQKFYMCGRWYRPLGRV